MDCSVYIRRFVAVLLCCVLAFHSALPVARAAEPVSASLAIAGGAIALAGVSGAAITNTIGPQVAAIVGTTMEGLGTSVYTSESSAKTKTQFIMEKIAVWCYQAGKAKEDFYKTVASGVSVAANGTIQLGKNACEQISQFVNWLYSEEGQVVAPEATIPGDSLSFGDLNVPMYKSLNVMQSGNVSFTYTSDVPFVAVSNGGSRFAFYFLEFPEAFYSGNNHITSGFNTVTSKAKQRAYRYSVNISTSPPSTLEYTSAVTNEYLNWWTNQTQVGSIAENPAYDEVFTGTPETWDENKDLLNPAGDDVTTVSPDVYSSLLAQMEQGQVATMGINTYLDSLVSAFDGLKAQVAELTDAVTGTSTSVAVPDTVTTEVSVDPVAPGVVPVVDPAELNPDGTIESFSFPLDEIFPFCIPFDVAAALSLFDVPAEAPALHVHWDLPYNIVFDFDLDLSAYDDIAALLRIMETILFCVGLAVATRGIFLRS